MKETSFNLARKPFLATRGIDSLTAVLFVLSAILVWFNATAWLGEKGSGSGAEQLTRQDDEIRRLTADIESVKRQTEGAVTPESQKEIDFLNTLIAERTFSWLRLLGRLEAATPAEVAYLSLAPSVKAASGSVELSLPGISRSREGLLHLIDNLNMDPAFSHPFPSHETDQEQSGNPDGRDFGLHVLYNAEKAAREPIPHFNPERISEPPAFRAGGWRRKSVVAARLA